MPFISVQRQLHGDNALSCDICQERIPLANRSQMGCFWLAPRLRKSSVSIPRIPGMPPMTNDDGVCPYYCASLPQVREAAVAWTWRDKGQLQLRYRHPSPVLLDSIDLYHGAVNEANAYLELELERKREQKCR